MTIDHALALAFVAGWVWVACSRDRDDLTDRLVYWICACLIVLAWVRL